MFENVSILIPYQSDHGPRDIAFNWIKKFYKRNMPNAELCIGISNQKLFNRSQAINLAAKKATGDIFVIADGDIFYNPVIITEAIKELKNACWVFPFETIVNLTKENTVSLLSTRAKWPLNIPIDYSDVTKNGGFGKLNVIKRDVFESINGFDERFKGWGGEDLAFHYTIKTLCGEDTRLNHEIYHMWHPPMNYSKNPNGEYNIQLRERYKQARGNKKDMMKLIREKTRYAERNS